METIRGKMSHTLDSTTLQARLANYSAITLDLGTGDGKFAFCHAESFPGRFVIGLDSCRENLREFSRTKLPNLLYVIASAQALPKELSGLVSYVTINFPWGSLLGSLLTGDPLLLCGLESVLTTGAKLDLRLNGGALAEAGWTFEDGVAQVRENLVRAGWRINQPAPMDSHDLHAFPSSWAKRLAFGRDPRAIQLSGCI
ncbi:16S rRNA (adenine(1408)-N(1))-methyltransferase [Anaerolineales bacterium]|nr:16S rRNA (adenine(1408)-N(1))-methyltransferase [Anaerolineales bacterium]